MVDKFKWRGTGPTLGAVDDDKVRTDSSFHHRLADGHEFPGMADAKLEADRLAVGQFAQSRDEMHHLNRGVEGGMSCGRDAIDTRRHAARFGDLRADLRTRQDAAMARFCTLREFDLDHLHLGAS